MKTALTFLCSLLTVLSNAQITNNPSIFKVSSDSTFIVTREYSNWLVDEWIMEDNSTIVFSDSVEKWQINASIAKFGKNCRIIGNGYSGADGYSYLKEQARGLKGGDGTNGTKGKDLNITIGLLFTNDLYIEVNGGNGGNGGKGDKGSKGKNARCSKWGGAGAGHTGGTGGNGGNAGDGGNVIIKYWLPNQTYKADTIKTVPKGIRVSSYPGNVGLPGLGGKGGEGGSAKKCRFFKHGKGDSGRKGSSGEQGKEGIDGTVKIIAISQP